MHQIKLLFHGSRITVLNLPYKGVLLFKQNVHQIKLLFHGSRITVLTFTAISIGIKEQNRIKLFFTSNQAIFSREPYNRISRITVLSFTVLRHEKQKSNQAIFLRKPYNRFTSDVLHITLIVPKKRISYFFHQSSYFFHGSRITVFLSYRARQGIKSQ